MCHLKDRLSFERNAQSPRAQADTHSQWVASIIQYMYFKAYAEASKQRRKAYVFITRHVRALLGGTNILSGFGGSPHNPSAAPLPALACDILKLNSLGSSATVVRLERRIGGCSISSGAPIAR